MSFISFKDVSQNKISKNIMKTILKNSLFGIMTCVSLAHIGNVNAALTPSAPTYTSDTTRIQNTHELENFHKSYTGVQKYIANSYNSASDIIKDIVNQINTIENNKAITNGTSDSNDIRAIINNTTKLKLSNVICLDCIVNCLDSSTLNNLNKFTIDISNNYKISGNVRQYLNGKTIIRFDELLSLSKIRLIQSFFEKLNGEAITDNWFDPFAESFGEALIYFIKEFAVTNNIKINPDTRNLILNCNQASTNFLTLIDDITAKYNNDINLLKNVAEIESCRKSKEDVINEYIEKLEYETEKLQIKNEPEINPEISAINESKKSIELPDQKQFTESVKGLIKKIGDGTINGNDFPYTESDSFDSYIRKDLIYFKQIYAIFILTKDKMSPKNQKVTINFLTSFKTNIINELKENDKNRLSYLRTLTLPTYLLERTFLKDSGLCSFSKDISKTINFHIPTDLYQNNIIEDSTNMEYIEKFLDDTYKILP